MERKTKTNGFNALNANAIYAYADSENAGSKYILGKLGFEKTGEFDEDGVICFWYELKREKYSKK